MSNSANVNSVDAIRLFAAAVMKFQEEARLCLSMMDAQLRQRNFHQTAKFGELSLKVVTMLANR